MSTFYIHIKLYFYHIRIRLNTNFNILVGLFKKINRINRALLCFGSDMTKIKKF